MTSKFSNTCYGDDTFIRDIIENFCTKLEIYKRKSIIFFEQSMFSTLASYFLHENGSTYCSSQIVNQYTQNIWELEVQKINYLTIQ